MIKINLEEAKTLEDVRKVIQVIRNDGGSMEPFEFEITDGLLDDIIVYKHKESHKATMFGVPCTIVDRIDTDKVNKAIDKVTNNPAYSGRLFAHLQIWKRDLLKELGLGK